MAENLLMISLFTHHISLSLMPFPPGFITLFSSFCLVPCHPHTSPNPISRNDLSSAFVFFLARSFCLFFASLAFVLFCIPSATLCSYSTLCFTMHLSERRSSRVRGFFSVQ